YGEETAFENTLDEALDAVFGVTGSDEQDTGETTPGDKEETTTPPPAGDATLQEALDDAQKAFDAGQKALGKQDWEAYGKAQKDLEDALERAAEAERSAGGDGKNSAAKDSAAKDGGKSGEKNQSSGDGADKNEGRREE
ncbi:MAG TPA: UPF0182 family protein, partial [Streptomyces sp.]|nr:UPF0182 family protein [Streptomyces sp.]